MTAKEKTKLEILRKKQDFLEKQTRMFFKKLEKNGSRRKRNVEPFNFHLN